MGPFIIVFPEYSVLEHGLLWQLIEWLVIKSSKNSYSLTKGLTQFKSLISSHTGRFGIDHIQQLDFLHPFSASFSYTYSSKQWANDWGLHSSVLLFKFPCRYSYFVVWYDKKMVFSFFNHLKKLYFSNYICDYTWHDFSWEFFSHN